MFGKIMFKKWSTHGDLKIHTLTTHMVGKRHFF